MQFRQTLPEQTGCKGGPGQFPCLKESRRSSSPLRLRCWHNQSGFQSPTHTAAIQTDKSFRPSRCITVAWKWNIHCILPRTNQTGADRSGYLKRLAPPVLWTQPPHSGRPLQPGQASVFIHFFILFLPFRLISYGIWSYFILPSDSITILLRIITTILEILYDSQHFIFSKPWFLSYSYSFTTCKYWFYI